MQSSTVARKCAAPCVPNLPRGIRWVLSEQATRQYCLFLLKGPPMCDGGFKVVLLSYDVGETWVS